MPTDFARLTRSTRRSDDEPEGWIYVHVERLDAYQAAVEALEWVLEDAFPGGPSGSDPESAKAGYAALSRLDPFSKGQASAAAYRLKEEADRSKLARWLDSMALSRLRRLRTKWVKR